MIKKISIKNYKSIVSDEIELGRVNVFIGENGAGKSNILEAVAMYSTAEGGNLSVENLYNKGIRVTKPGLMFSSFLEKKQQDSIKINVESDELKDLKSEIIAKSPDDIYTRWITKEDEVKTEEFWSKARQFSDKLSDYLNDVPRNDEQEYQKRIDEIIERIPEKLEIIPETSQERMERKMRHIISSYQIYTLSTPALRGITKTSLRQPLGLYGEGLDILLSTFTKEEWELLKEYSYFISWLEDIVTDEKDTLKFDGHKLGRSTSTLYFKDQFMRKNNNIFAAENANEGALHILFYLALFISKKTPSFFAIDNIETALNPKLCRTLMKNIAELAKKTEKQVLITTHNPAVLDGINLNDDEQRLFVVSRTKEGHTKTKRIKFKPPNNQSKYKLSELWMRGDLGGIPNNFL